MNFLKILTCLDHGEISHAEFYMKLRELGYTVGGCFGSVIGRFDSPERMDEIFDQWTEELDFSRPLKDSKLCEFFLSKGVAMEDLIYFITINDSNGEDMTNLLIPSGCSLEDFVGRMDCKRKAWKIIQILLSNGFDADQLLTAFIRQKHRENPVIIAAILRKNPRNLNYDPIIENPEVCAMLLNRGLHHQVESPEVQAYQYVERRLRQGELQLRKHPDKYVNLEKFRSVCRDRLDELDNEIKEWEVDFKFTLKDNIQQVRILLDATFY